MILFGLVIWSAIWIVCGLWVSHAVWVVVWIVNLLAVLWAPGGRGPHA